MRAVPWLPSPTSDDAEAAVSKTITIWIATWLAGPPDLTCRQLPRSEARVTRWQGSPLALVGSEDEVALHLGLAICDGHAEVANRRDRQLLTGLGEEMLRDLSDHLRDAIGADLLASDAVAADYCFRLSPVKGDWSIFVALRPESLVRLRQKAAGRGREPALGEMAMALANMPLALGCHLGKAVLSAGQIHALSIGDLIVFDTDVTSPLALTVAHETTAAGAARVGTVDGAVKMTLVEPISLKRKASSLHV